MLPVHAMGESRATRLSWPLPALILPLLYLSLAWSWWGEIRSQLATAGEAAPAIDPGVMAMVGLGTRGLGNLSEAGCYALWWRSRGLRLPFWRFSAWIAALSFADLFGFALRRATHDATDAVRLLAAVLAGFGLLERSAVPASGAIAAFGNLGVLTLLRVGATAWAQAQGIGRPLGGPLVVTTTAWLLTRLAAWWSLDLLQGMSPVR